MANDKDPETKQPGEEEEGKFHYNPGNMSGKTVDIGKDESKQRANADRIKARHEEQGKKGRSDTGRGVRDATHPQTGASHFDEPMK